MPLFFVLLGLLSVHVATVAVVYGSIERKSRAAWSAVPVKKKKHQTAYRGEIAPTVSGYHQRAPKTVRAAMMASLFFAPLLPFEWAIDRFRASAHERPFASSVRAAHALMMRKEHALQHAHTAGESRSLLTLGAGSLVFALVPLLHTHPLLLAVLFAAVAVLGISARQLARLRDTHEEVFADHKDGIAREAHAEPAESADKAVPEWLTRALARRAETRPQVRVESTPLPNVEEAMARIRVGGPAMDEGVSMNAHEELAAIIEDAEGTRRARR